MSGKVSLDVFFDGVADKERVELSNQILPSVLVLAVLNVEQVLYAAASLFQDSID